MLNIMNRAALAAAVLIGLGGCSVNQHRNGMQDDGSDRLTVGTVQREITVGMSSTDVASVLGSPNIVTSDDARRETWIYDKISSEVAYSRSSAGVAGLIFGGNGGGLGAGSVGSGVTQKTQRTLTVLVHFDQDSRVRDFAYHTSRF